jgi:hypothetical protein
MSTIPYTYLIGWSNLNIWYYGVRFQKDCNPDDLWKSYFTSSKHVKKFIKDHGDPDVRTVRKIFEDSKSARYWEHKVLRRLNARDDNKFLNKTNGDGRFFNLGHTVEAREKISKKLKGIKRTEEMKEHLSTVNKGRLSGEKNGMFGKTHSEEAKKKISQAVKNRTFWVQKGKTYEEIQSDSEAAKKRKEAHSNWMKKNNPFKGKKHTEETKQKMRLKAQQRELNKTKEPQ